jgi:hypothetical protein
MPTNQALLVVMLMHTIIAVPCAFPAQVPIREDISPRSMPTARCWSHPRRVEPRCCWAGDLSMTALSYVEHAQVIGPVPAWGMGTRKRRWPLMGLLTWSE